MKRTVLWFLVGLFTFGFVGCGDDGGETPGQLSLTPQGAVVMVGDDVTLTAKQGDVAASGGTWTTSSAAIATVTPGSGGTATVHGVAAGSATIKVMVGTESAQVTVMVSEVALTGIAVTPATPSIALGTTTQLTATAMFDDGSMMDVSSMATWTSGTTANATVDSDGTVESVAVGTSTITAELSGKSGTATVTVTDAELVSATLTPSTPTIADGLTVQMTVTGHFSDDTNQDITADVTWASATQTVATVDAGGLVTAVDPGTSVISAAVPSGPTLMTTVTVGAKELVSLEITPDDPTIARGLTQQMTATGHFTDGSTDDLTATVTWTSATMTVAPISPAGLVTALDPGTSVIKAMMGTIFDTTTVAVGAKALISIDVTTPISTIEVGLTTQLSAMGNYSDGSTDNITGSVTWTSSDDDIATVMGGSVEGISAGTVTITAELASVSGSLDVTVTQTAASPTVTATFPVDASTDQSALSVIGVTFDQAMNPATLTAQAAAGACSGSIQVSSDDFTSCVGLAAPVVSAGVTFATSTTAVPLSCGETYKIRVTTAAQNAGGLGLAADFTTATGFTTTVGPTCATGRVIMSQVYPGGGNSGAPLNADFVELHNVTGAAVSIDGLAIQYASATGPSPATAPWQVTPLPDVSIPGGGYFLLQISGTGTNGSAYTSDFVANPTIGLGSSAGKVALTASTTALIGPSPTAGILDLVGYGPTANFYEGTAPTAALSNTTAAIRAGSGCTDNNQNSTDFTVGAPAPRSSATTALVCTITANETGTPAELDFCSLLTPPMSTVQTGMATEALLGKVYEATVTETAGAAANVVAQVGYGPASSNPEFQLGWSWFAMTYDSQVANDDVYSGTFTAPAAGTYAYTTRFSLDAGTNWTYCDLDGAGSNAGLAFNAAQLGVLTVTP